MRLDQSCADYIKNLEEDFYPKDSEKILKENCVELLQVVMRQSVMPELDYLRWPYKIWGKLAGEKGDWIQE